MMKKILVSLVVFMMTTVSALAGGILTNTNQSVDFLRNPARDAAIGLDGVYSNPAGVVFMPEGFHLGINWQYAHQTRTITSTNPVFQLGRKNNANNPTKIFEGVANAPIIPSIQVAYNMENWSLQANLSVPGGGGSCEFSDGLGSFESVVGNIAAMLAPLGATGYDMDGYMKGRQYYYGVQIGAACKVTPNLSLYGGLRMLYGDATYKAKISNIQVKTANGYVDFGSYLQAVTEAGYGEVVAPLQKYSDGVNLLCNQDGVGFAPIVGVDYKIGKFNFAAKYEFRTQIRMKNESTVNEASAIEAVNKYRDGENVNEDMPALLAVGVQYSPIDVVRINAGYHHYFDKDASWYNNSQELLKHNTNEYLLGAEWDTTENLTFSAGGQLTRYGMSDEYISDMSFVVNSYSIGFGFNYKLSNKVAIKAAYFQTYYGDYDRTDATNPQVKDSFTRTNRVFGVGCELSL
ncbi:MAG: transporter [Prevotella sp.]|nr:transporter [Prevotella sp.]MBQ6406223.1 transporter [Prevotella sp.]